MDSRNEMRSENEREWGEMKTTTSEIATIFWTDEICQSTNSSTHMEASGGVDVNVKKINFRQVQNSFFSFAQNYLTGFQKFSQYLLCIPAFRLTECLAVCTKASSPIRLSKWETYRLHFLVPVSYIHTLLTTTQPREDLISKSMTNCLFHTVRRW